MTKLVGGFRKAVFPLCVFVGVVLIHFAWFCFFPEQEPAQSRWATITGSSSSAKRYIETQSYWLGYSYALAFSFAAVAFRAYRERRSCSARSMAIGGVTLSGFLAIAGCYLIGCCGSPMLGVYLSLFGTAFLPLTKPLIAIFTTVSVGLSWWWMRRQERGESTASLLKVHN